MCVNDVCICRISEKVCVCVCEKERESGRGREMRAGRSLAAATATTTKAAASASRCALSLSKHFPFQTHTRPAGRERVRRSEEEMKRMMEEDALIASAAMRNIFTEKPPQAVATTSAAADDGVGLMSHRTVRALLEPMVNANRLRLIERVAHNRNFHVVPILEGVHDSGNIGAVARTAEGLGFGSIAIIETHNGGRSEDTHNGGRSKDTHNGGRSKDAQQAYSARQARNVSKSADKWLSVHRFSDTEECIAAYRSKGYRILATHLNAAEPENDISLESVLFAPDPHVIPDSRIGAVAADARRPTAIVFGNEHAGVSEAALARVDANVYIPMKGFVESFNISVAAAIVLGHAARQIRAANRRVIAPEDEEDAIGLNALEVEILTAELLARSVDRSHEILLAHANLSSLGADV